MLEAFGRAMRLPLSVFIFAMERMTAALDRVDRATEESWQAVLTRVEPQAPPSAAAPPPRPAAPRPATPAPDPHDDQPDDFHDPGAAKPAAPNPEEERKVPDTNLMDDMVKLVRYSIVSIERDHLEKLVTGDYELFDENMDAQSFANWVTAKHSAKLSGKDSKYLRVSYEVLQRWPKQDREFERKQLDELRGIRVAMENR